MNLHLSTSEMLDVLAALRTAQQPPAGVAWGYPQDRAVRLARDLVEQLGADRKITAIRLLVAATAYELRECKDLIEAQLAMRHG